ncbi:MAG TPA: Arc family DNA-binding protein [Klebsiella sp.]
MTEKDNPSFIERFTVRMPDGMRDAIAERAKANGRSMNSEIIQILQDALAEPCQESLAKANFAAEGNNLPPVTEDMKVWADHLRKQENSPELEGLLRSIVKMLAVVAPAITGEEGLQQILKNSAKPESIVDAISDKKPT